MSDNGGTNSNNETLVYMTNDGGAEAAKEIVHLMESLSRAGCKDCFKITFNLPQRCSKLYTRKMIRMATPYYKASIYLNKMPQYKIFRNIHCTAINNSAKQITAPLAPCCNSIKSVRSIGTDVSTLAKSSNYNDLQLRNYCKFMSQQLDMLTMCLKRISEVIQHTEPSVNGLQYEPPLDVQDQLIKVSNQQLQIEQNNEIDIIDEFTFVLQQLYENFDTIIPILEKNSGCAKQLISLVFKCKNRINKLEENLLRFIPAAGVEAGEQTSELNIKQEENQIEKSTVTRQFIDEPYEKQLNKSNSTQTFAINPVNSFLQSVSGKREGSAACVLLPKGYHIIKSSPDFNEEFNIYQVQKNTDDQIEVTDRSKINIKPMTSFPPKLVDDQESQVSTSEDCLTKMLLDIKPSIAADEIPQSFYSLNIFAEKQSIQNYNVRIIQSMVQETTNEILENISNLSELITCKKKLEVHCRKEQGVIDEQKISTTKSVKTIMKSAKKKSTKTCEGSNYLNIGKPSKSRSTQKMKQCLMM